jgi:cytoskeletal protein CcmA (bactofilin family)
MPVVAPGSMRVMRTTKGRIQPEKKTQSEKLDTYIGEETYFDGRLTSKENLCIYGKVKGTIECQGRVVVGESGNVEADILTNDVVVSGRVLGNVTAKNKLEMVSSGVVQGDVKTSRLIMADGSKLEGNCEMLLDGKAIVIEEIKALDADASIGTALQQDSKVPSGVLHN